MTVDEMVGGHHQLDVHGFGWTPGVGDGQGGLACCYSWGRKESDTTEQLNRTCNLTTGNLSHFLGVFLVYLVSAQMHKGSKYLERRHRCNGLSLFPKRHLINV